jgi:hypothetical protein
MQVESLKKIGLEELEEKRVSLLLERASKMTLSDSPKFGASTLRQSSMTDKTYDQSDCTLDSEDS